MHISDCLFLHNIFIFSIKRSSSFYFFLFFDNFIRYMSLVLRAFKIYSVRYLRRHMLFCILSVSYPALPREWKPMVKENEKVFWVYFVSRSCQILFFFFLFYHQILLLFFLFFFPGVFYFCFTFSCRIYVSNTKYMYIYVFIYFWYNYLFSHRYLLIPYFFAFSLFHLDFLFAVKNVDNC